jgi:hypothetical protein
LIELVIREQLIDPFASRALQTELARSDVDWITQIAARSLGKFEDLLTKVLHHPVGDALHHAMRSG